VEERRGVRAGGRDGLLLRLAATGGVYVPKFYDVEYLADGRIGSGRSRTAPVCPRQVAKHTLSTSTSGRTRRSRSSRSPRRCTSG
jgi:hypothetical protein